MKYGIAVKRKILSVVSLFMVIVMLLSNFTACKKPQNDDDREEDEEYMKAHDEVLEITLNETAVPLVALGDSVAYEKMGLIPSYDVCEEESGCSGRWSKSGGKYVSLKIDSVGDITQYEGISISIYNPGNSLSSVLQFCINCQLSPIDTNPNRRSYKRYQINVDWTGWKTVTMTFSELADAYGADLSQVENMSVNATGWDTMGTKLYDDIYIGAVNYVNVTYVPSITDIGDYNYDHIKETYISILTGGMDMSSVSSVYATKLASYVEEAKTVRARLSKDDKAPFAYDMTTTAGITSNYEDIRIMAIGYAIEGGELYRDDGLLRDIVDAMEMMHENYYKSQLLNKYPKRDNWWDWQIGSAQAIVDIILLVEDDIPSDYIDKWLTPVNRYVPLPSLTMANRVDLAYVAIGAAALQKDAVRIVRSVKALDECCTYVEKGDGFYADGSFIQHDTIAYTGSYGPIMLEGLSKLLLAASDTCFRFDGAMIAHQYNWAINSFTPLMFHGAFFGSVRGRSIHRDSTDVSLGLAAVEGMLRMTQYLKDSSKCNIIKSIIKEYAAYNGAYYESEFDPHSLKILNSVLTDESIEERTDFEFAKVFARMDRPIAQLEKYGVSISMSSSRIAKYEAINEENRDGWYTGDGMLYVYTTVNDYSPEFWHNVNKYRLPGTTVTTAPRNDTLNIKQNNTLSQYDFVGGTSLGNSLIAAMQFESSTTKMESATDGTKFVSTLNGKKAWFVFDNEIVCLGAGISCSDKYDTLTVIENRRMEAGKLFMADGDVVEGSGKLSGKSALHIGGFGGIYLPEKDTVTYNRTDGEVEFLELYFNQGKNLSNETYSYVLLPVMSEAGTRNYAANPEITILSNTDKVMAVKDKSTGITGYIFWKAGTFNGVTVNAPCTVMVSDREISCADPTQKLSSVTVTLNGEDYTFNNIAKGATEIKNIG